MPGYFAPRYFAKRFFAGRYFPPPGELDFANLGALIEVRGGIGSLAFHWTNQGAVINVAGGDGVELTFTKLMTSEGARIDVRSGDAGSLDIGLTSGGALLNVVGGGAGTLAFEWSSDGGQVQVIGGDAGTIETSYVFTSAGGRIEVRGGVAVVFDLTQRLIGSPRPRVEIYDGATLAKIAELVHVSDVNRSFALHQHVRTAVFTFGESDELSRRYTRPLDAHVVLIVSDEYPHPWVGRIVQREADRGNRTVTVTADSYEAILGERTLPADFTTPRGTKQALARVLGRINGQNPTGIGLGHVEETLAPPLSLSNAQGMEAVEKVAQVTGMEWWLSCEVERGQLRIRLNMAQERGADYSQVAAIAQPGNWHVAGWRENGKANAYAQTVVGGESSVLEAFTERPRAVAKVGTEGLGPDSVTETLIIEARRSLAFGYPFLGSSSFRAPTQRRELRSVIEELKAEGYGEAAAALLQTRRLSERLIAGRIYPEVEGARSRLWQYLRPGDVVRAVSADAFLDGYEGVARVVGVQPMEHERFVDVVLEVQ